MDLFFANHTELEEGDWKDVKHSPKHLYCKVMAKLKDGSMVCAYFYTDAASWIMRYGAKSCSYWHSQTHEPLFDVTHWKLLMEKR